MVQARLAREPAAPVRESPTLSPLYTGPDPAHPNVGTNSSQPEPVLAVDQIQGNIFPGFMKDFQTLLFLQIKDGEGAACKAWVQSIVPLIATTAEVVAFNRLFKAIRGRRGQDSGAVKATWINIAFSAEGLRQLGVDVDAFQDQAFKEGMAARAEGVNGLGDPSDPDEEGNPRKWLVGGPYNPADIVLIVASDDRDDLFTQVEALEDTIFAFRSGGQAAPSGVRVIFKQHGANLPGAMSGHEHFGFLDGVSQPGVRGRLSSDANDVLTPRQNPREPEDQGKPGQDLLWPGEFVFGYQGQDPEQSVDKPSPDPEKAGLDWADNGSFLVFRRLRQDVAGFHTFLNEQAAPLGIGPRRLGAALVGRWPSGAPIMRGDDIDRAALGANDCANNDFEFFSEDPFLADPTDPAKKPPDTTPPVAAGDAQCRAPRLFIPSPGDQPGAICPFVAHIRKAYPRDDITPEGSGGGATTPEEQSARSEQTTQTHRLLRRGIPFGPVSRSTPDVPFTDDIDRGLLFLAYQTSIEQQFEFVTRQWVNEPAFRVPGVGHDPIIGQNARPGEGRARTFTVTFTDGGGSTRTVSLTAPKDWVIPTGGGYFFAPSIAALQSLP